MTTGVLRLTDVIVPAVFTPMVRRLSIEKSVFIASGAAVQDASLNAFLAGAGLTVNMPRGAVLDTSDVENVSSDDPTVFSTPNKFNEAVEIAVRLSRNNSWSDMDLVSALLGRDPMANIAEAVAAYWTARRERAFISHLAGIFANNATATDAYHVQNDMTRDVSGASYSAGVTGFGGGAFIDAQLTMGDAMDTLTLILMHPVVYAAARKQNMITFIQPSAVDPAIPTYQGARVIISDKMPSPASGVFESWLLGAGAFLYGTGSPQIPTEVLRIPAAGNGGGQDVMHDRVEWAMHVPGTAYVGTPPNGGPSNAATTNNIAAAASWRRVATDRRYVKIARVITREY